MSIEFSLIRMLYVIQYVFGYRKFLNVPGITGDNAAAYPTKSLKGVREIYFAGVQLRLKKVEVDVCLDIECFIVLWQKRILFEIV